MWQNLSDQLPRNDDELPQLYLDINNTILKKKNYNRMLSPNAFFKHTSLETEHEEEREGCLQMFVVIVAIMGFIPFIVWLALWNVNVFVIAVLCVLYFAGVT